MKYTIHRVYGPIKYQNEGIWKYSDMYRQGLESQGFFIKQYIIPFGPRSLLRFLYQFIFLPFLLYWNTKKQDTIIFYEEFYTPLSFLFSENTYYIIHHIKPEILKTENVSIFGKLFIKIYLYSLQQLKKVKGIITVSEDSKQEIIKIGVPQNKIHTLYNAFDDNIFIPGNSESQHILKKKYNIPKNMKVFCHISVFHPRKNFQTIIESLSFYNEHPFHLIKVGSILDNDEYEKNIYALKKHQIPYTYIENLDDHELVLLLQGVDIFLFSSTFEGFGRPPILAQLCGCPVISTHGGALEEVLGNSCYIIKSPFNAKEYTNGIKKILSDNNYKNNLIKNGLKNSKRYALSTLIQKSIDVLG